MPKKERTGPKRSLSAYMFFAKDVRPQLVKDYPDATFGEIGKKLGVAWQSASKETKAKYEQKAQADKKRYEKDKAGMST